MAKIETYILATQPLSFSDMLIGTEVGGPIPNATKNFSLGELYNLFSSLPAVGNLQQTLNAGNIATQNIFLTGNIETSTIKPVYIIDGLNSTGAVGEVLIRSFSGISWGPIPPSTLQQVLDAGNTATQNIVLTGNITSTQIIPGNIKDGLGNLGTTGQILSKTATGIQWINNSTGIQDLNSVLSIGNSSLLNADIGELGLWDTVNLYYNYLRTVDNSLEFRLNSGQLVFITEQGYISFSGGVSGLSTSTIFNSFLTANRTYNLPDQNGTIPLSVNGFTASVLGNISIPISTFSPLTTKGDLYTFSTVNTRLPVGLNTQVLIADSSQPTGLRWGSNTAPVPLGYYGQYFDYNDQNATINNVGVPMIFGTLDLSNGITVVSDGTNLTKITFANSGVYNLQFSTQFENLSNAPQDIFIWLRKNGTTTAFDVVGSTGYVGLEPRKNPGDPYHTIVTWNFLLDIIAGDFYQIVWATTDITNVGIRFNAGTVNFPSTASTLFTVTQQSGIMAGTGVTNVSAAMTNPSQTVAVTNPTTIPNITIDDTNLLYNKFMVNQYSYIFPSDGNILWDTLRVGGTILSTGTITALSENPMGQLFTTAAAVSSVVALYGTSFGGSGYLGVNFDFDFSYRFRINTNNAAQRFFCGISALYPTAAPTNVEPTTLINSIGLAKLSTSNNFYFVWNDATGTASSSDLGASFSAVDTTSTWRMRIYKKSGIAAVNLELTKITNTGIITVTTLTITSDYNTGATSYPVIWMGNSTTVAGAVSFKNYGCQMTKRSLINA
jgi:hypothetical protein